MTVDYLTSPRGHAQEAACAVHLINGEAWAARETACGLPTSGLLMTEKLERVTCRACREEIAAA